MSQKRDWQGLPIQQLVKIRRFPCPFILFLTTIYIALSHSISIKLAQWERVGLMSRRTVRSKPPLDITIGVQEHLGSDAVFLAVFFLAVLPHHFPILDYHFCQVGVVCGRMSRGKSALAGKGPTIRTHDPPSHFPSILFLVIS